MFDKFLDYFGEKNEVTYSGDMYHDFIMQLGGRRFGRGLFNSFSNDNINKWTQIMSYIFHVPLKDFSTRKYHYIQMHV